MAAGERGVGAGGRREVFFGWPMLAVCTVVFIASAPGQTVVVSQFNRSISESLGLSQTALSGAYLVGTVAAAVPLVLVGTLSDRFGPRLVTAAVAGLFGLACVLAGQARGLVSLTVAFFLLRLLGQGSLGVLSGHALALWFERRLGTANGIKLVGAQLGFAIAPVVAVGLIAALGWRAAYAALGLWVWALVLPKVLLVSRDRPEEVGQRIDGDPPLAPAAAKTEGDGGGAVAGDGLHVDPAFTLRDAMRTRAYWVLAAATMMNGLVGTALLFHAQPLLEGSGLPASASASLAMAWSLSMSIAVLPLGRLSDLAPPSALLSAGAGLLGVASLLFVWLGSVGVGLAAMACFGVSQAATFATAVPTIARYFGRAHHGAIRGSVSRLSVVGTGLGPLVLGLSVDGLGSYTPGLAALACGCLGLAAACATLRRPATPDRA